MVERLFCNCLHDDAHSSFLSIQDLKVSAHLFIDRSGAISQFVPFHLRAWHAGASCYQGRDGCNDFSIGVELEGTDRGSYSEKQYQVLTDVTLALCREYPTLTLDQIVGHSDIAPGRKTDPGPGFDWQRFRALLEEG